MLRSMAVRWWLAFVGLTLGLLCLLALVLNQFLTAFYVRQATAPLVTAANSYSRMLAADPNAARIAPQIGQLFGAYVQVLSPQGVAVYAPNSTPVQLPGAAMQRLAQGETFAGRTRDSLGDDLVVAAAPFFQDGKLQGAVLLLSPAGAVTEAQGNLHWLLVSTLSGGAAVAAALGFIFARYQVRPIVAMEEAARAIAAGELGIQVQLQRSDELGALAGAINEMSAALAGHEQRRREFLANVAHELRTPLSYLQGYSQALAEGMVEDDLERERYVRILHEEARRLGRLVEDLMDLAEMDEGSARLEPRLLPVTDTVAQAVATLRPRADSKGVTLTVAVEPGLAVVADPDRLQQVLINLLDNALRHSPAGGQVTVTAQVSTTEPDMVQLTVADTGPGFPPAEAERVFERFHKVDRSRHEGGRGLGLAIVRSIVRAHGGQVWAESSPGQGARFHVLLPSPPEAG